MGCGGVKIEETQEVVYCTDVQWREWPTARCGLQHSCMGVAYSTAALWKTAEVGAPRASMEWDVVG